MPRKPKKPHILLCADPNNIASAKREKSSLKALAAAWRK